MPDWGWAIVIFIGVPLVVVPFAFWVASMDYDSRHNDGDVTP